MWHISTYVFPSVSTDLNYLEETAGGPNLTVATLPKSGKIVLVQVRSFTTIDIHTYNTAGAQRRGGKLTIPCMGK